MHSLFATRTGSALYLLVWLLIGTMLAGLIVGSTGAAWTNVLIFALPVTMLYAFGAGFSSFYLCRAYPLADKNPITIVVIFCIAASLAAGMWGGIALAWNSFWQAGGMEWAGLEWTPFLRALIFSFGVVLYGLSAVVHYLVVEFERARAAERRELESKVMAQEAELRMLRTQIDPHFLFNCLNSISALTSMNPAAARDMTLQLSDFFRQSLSMEAHKKVSVDAEMKLIAHFLAIEKIRFGARLQSDTQVDADAALCSLPPMILQPLVENAVKHGIGNLPDGGTVRIRAERQGSLLRLSVENDVDPDTPSRKGSGIGLANVRQRLATEYGREAIMQWTRRDNQFRVDISLPAEPLE